MKKIKSEWLVKCNNCGFNAAIQVIETISRSKDAISVINHRDMASTIATGAHILASTTQSYNCCIEVYEDTKQMREKLEINPTEIFSGIFLRGKFK